MMKALSLWQPWASLMAFREKMVETRHWKTKLRCLVAIHAAQKCIRARDLEHDREIENALNRNLIPRKKNKKGEEDFDLTRGAFVAIGELYDCVRFTKESLARLNLSEDERAFGNYTLGRYGFLFRNIRRLAVPIERPGRQGFFNVDTRLFEGATFR